MRFGQLLRDLRTGMGLSPHPLAVVIGVSHTYLSKIETGNFDFGDLPSEEMILKRVAAEKPRRTKFFSWPRRSLSGQTPF
jgi:transcriptional regulator with XRE-family HTH domain